MSARYAIKRGAYWLSQSQTWIRTVTARHRPMLALFQAHEVSDVLLGLSSVRGAQAYLYAATKPASHWQRVNNLSFDDFIVQPAAAPTAVNNTPTPLMIELDRANNHAEELRLALLRARGGAVTGRQDFAALVLEDLLGQAVHLARGVGAANEAAKNGGAT